MSNMSTTELHSSPVLNPSDPLVFLSPELAWHLNVARYICVGTMGAFLWDVLSNMIGHYQLLFHHRIRVPTVVYFISIMTSLTYVTGSAILLTMPVPNCALLKKGLEAVYSVAVPATSLLFFFRTRAVFDGDQRTVVFFACMWLAVLGACTAPIVGVSAGNIGPTRYCLSDVAKPYAATAVVVPLINDTLIFIAITWCLWCNSTARRTVKDGIRVLVFGDYLPAFSKAMLQNGQAYYLTTVTFNVITVTLYYISSLPPLRILFVAPNMAMMNIMACRVFRNTKLGLPVENVIPTNVIQASEDSARLTVMSGLS